MKTNKTLKLTYASGESTEYYIYKGRKFTPYGYCVEYDDYYEIAMYSWYMRIGKDGKTIRSNRDNVNEYRIHDGVTATVIKG